MDRQHQITTCTHDDAEFNRAEPDVGIMTAYWACEDCGQSTSNWDWDTDDDGHQWKVPEWADPVHVMVPEGFYVIIDRLHPDEYEHVVIGPWADEDSAVRHLQDSMQVQGICEDDAQDASVGTAEDAAEAIAYWIGEEEPWEQYDIVEDEW